MANTQYKKTTLAKGYVPASSAELSSPAVLRRAPFVAAHRSQDSVLDGRRLLASLHGGAGGAWLSDGTVGVGAGAQAHPDAVTWREVHRVRTEQAPGQVVHVRCLAARSGPAEFDQPSTGTWELATLTGSIKIDLTWTNTAAQTATRSVQWGLPGTGDAEGLEDTGAGSVWQSLLHKVIQLPPGPGNQAITASEQVKWSEWPTIDVVVSHRGGVRAIHTSVVEYAGEHVTLHTTTSATTANGAADWPPYIRRPLEEEADGGAYEEHRHGTHRLLYAAARQTERVGPRLARWSAYDELDAEPADSTPDPVQVTSSSFRRVSWGVANTNTTWDANAPGFDMPQSRRAPENLPSRVSGAASSPVRARVYCRFTTSGSQVGVLRLQSTPRSWIDVNIRQATVGTTWQWVAANGWLETAIAGDDSYPILQDFAKVSVGFGTLEIREWELAYGDYEVGA